LCAVASGFRANEGTEFFASGEKSKAAGSRELRRAAGIVRQIPRFSAWMAIYSGDKSRECLEISQIVAELFATEP
jgi:hypothetical protein